eukprot:2495498-Ditylum_brightwellii.AAC.1
MMTLAVNLGLKLRQVDYTNAFVQVSLLPGEEFGLWTGADTVNLVQQIVTGIVGFWLQAKHIRPVLIL